MWWIYSKPGTTLGVVQAGVSDSPGGPYTIANRNVTLRYKSFTSANIFIDRPTAKPPTTTAAAVAAAAAATSSTTESNPLSAAPTADVGAVASIAPGAAGTPRTPPTPPTPPRSPSLAAYVMYSSFRDPPSVYLDSGFI